MVLRRPQSLLPALALLALGTVLVDVIFAGVMLSHLLQGSQLSDWISFYTGGTLIRAGKGGHLYDASAQAAVQGQLWGGGGANMMGYPLPVFVALLFAPLSRLSFVTSYLVWLGINVALLAVLLRLSWRWLEGVHRTLRAIFLGCAVPVTSLWVLMQAQVDLFVLMGLTGCYSLLRANRPFTAGTVLAIALCKPHLAAPVVLLLLLKGQWRAIAGFVAAGVPLLIAPALVLGPHLLVDQAQLVLSYTSTAAAYDVS